MATAIYTDCDGLEVDGGLEEGEGGVCPCTALQTSSLLFFVVVVGLFFGTRCDARASCKHTLTLTT